MKKILLIIIIALAFAPAVSFSIAEKYVSFEVNPTKLKVKNGEQFFARLTVTFQGEWYTYAMFEQTSTDGIGPTPMEISAGTNNLIKITGKINPQKPKKKYDEGFEMDMWVYEKKAYFDIRLLSRLFQLKQNLLLFFHFFQL